MDINEFYQQDRRTTKQDISNNTINNLRVVNITSFDNDEIQEINFINKRLLSISKNKNESNEVGILLDLSNWCTYITIGSSERVSLKDNKDTKRLLMTAPRNSLVFFHNHPKNSIFSERDLSSFLLNDSIYMMVVICNNGRQYYLLKTEKFDNDNALMLYDNIYETDNNSAVKEFLRTCSKVGLEFIYGGEAYEK